MIDPTNMPANDVRKLIDRVPPKELPGILAAAVNACVRNKVFGKRRVSDIVITLEKSMGVKP